MVSWGPRSYTLTEVPADRAALLQKDFETTRGTTQKLTPEQMLRVYRWALTDPDWRKRFGLGPI